MPDSTPASGDHFRGTPEVQKYRPRACVSCARSKMRCVWPLEPGATPCQRCAKTKTSCTLPEINPRRRRGPSTRVGQLEEKIDGIMSLLNASQQIQQNSPSSGGQTPPPTGSTPAAPVLEPTRNSIHQLLNPNSDTKFTGANVRAEGTESVPTPSSSSNYHTNARLVPPAGLAPPASTAAGLGPSPESDYSNRGMRTATSEDYVEIVKDHRISFLEAERALALYRSVYQPSFPFVPISVMMSSRELYDKSPFLFRTIVSVVTPQPPSLQAEYRVWFREYVAQHVVVNNERPLEVLQAILVHLAWGDFYFVLDSQATNLIQLAVALVIDMGLNRWPLDSTTNFIMLKDAVASLGAKGPWKKKHTSDEMRAALGTFYICSLCSSLFRRHQPMVYNSYLHNCCSVLDEAHDFDSDRFLVTLVKIQRLLGRAANIIPDSDDESWSRIPYTPHHMALTASQKELEAIVREQPPDVERNALLWTNYHATICRLFEPAIYIRPTSIGGYDSANSKARTAALWQCLSSARDFFSACLAMGPLDLSCVPFQSAHLSFCLVTMVRLLFLGDEGGGVGSSAPPDSDWDLTLARESVGFEVVCARLSEAFDEADRACAETGRRLRYLNGERSVMAMYRDKTRWIRDWYVARTRPGARPPPSYGSGYAVGGAAGPGGASSSKDPGAAGGLGSGGGDAAAAAAAGAGGMSSSSLAAAAHGHQSAMDVDYGVQQQQQQQQQAAQMGGGSVPVDVDDSFWQVMFDWSWVTPMDLNEVQC